MTDPARAPLEARPATAAGAKAFVVTPFARLARTHAATTMADAMVATAFAGSLFFSLPADDARWPVLRYLIITMLPFSVLSPFVGPLIDRMKGGHRLVVLGSTGLRVLLCYLLIGQITGASTVFFLLALCLLVCQKAYQVARSALVPSVVRSDDELVEANSKLSLISGMSGFVGVLPAGILLKLFGPEWSVGLAMVVYAVAAVLATAIPRSRVADAPADETERHELRGAGIVLAGSAMGLLRACVGFLTLLVAFDFRGGDRPTWQFGVVGGASVLSQLLGAAVAPRVRNHTSEENLLTGALAVVVLGGLFSLVLGDVAGATLLGSCVGFAAGSGKLAFDAIVQRDAPDANRGRAFARFETRFQVTWVVGALVPVAYTVSASVGFAIVFGLAVIALVSYTIGRLASAHRAGHRQNAATAAAVGIEDRFAEVSGEVKDRIASAPRSAYRRLRPGPIADLDQDSGATGAELGDDPDSWPEPEWRDDGPAGGDATVVEGAGRRRRRGRRRGAPIDEPGAVPGGEITRPVGPGPESDLAAGSPMAWRPDDPETVYPWEPPAERHDAPGAYLDDVDPAVANPFPWTPDPTPNPPGQEVS